jgi:hypothetical protein
MAPNSTPSNISGSTSGFKLNEQDEHNAPSGRTLKEFGQNIWIVDGPNVRDMGVMFTTRMTIVKLHDGSVWVDSPVSASYETLKEITALGSIRYIVAETPRHVWRLSAWHTLFPEAQLWISRITPFTLKKGHLPYTGILTDTPVQAWEGDLEQLPFKGSPLIEEVLFLHKDSHTVIMGDLIQNHIVMKNHPISNAILKLEGVISPLGGVALDLKLAFTHRNIARNSLKKLLSWDFDKLIIAHGGCIEKDAKLYVERSFRWLER